MSPNDCLVARNCRCDPSRLEPGTYERDCHAHYRENPPICEVCDTRVTWWRCWSTGRFTGHRHCVERAGVAV